jgi:predicted enzyme related to lactoylglutathione lyase
MKLSGIMIGSDQPDILGEFYTKLFGAPGWHEDSWYGYDIGGGTLMIGPHSEVHGANTDAPRLMISIEAEDVKSTFQLFVDHGARLIAEPYQPDAKSNPTVWLSTVADPDNNYLQISAPWDNSAQ